MKNKDQINATIIVVAIMILFSYNWRSILQLMKNDNQNDLRQSCIRLGSVYESDVDGNELCDEVCDCKMLLATRHNFTPKSSLELLAFIISYGEDAFPNLRVALQILMTIAVSIASCERSFSKLKLILSYLRSSMEQDRLSDLALLSIEREAFNGLCFDDIIDIFAASKARKVML